MNVKSVDPCVSADEHWCYVEGVLENAWQNMRNRGNFDWNDVRDMIGHHYKTAFVHGFKHGKEYLCKDE